MFPEFNIQTSQLEFLLKRIFWFNGTGVTPSGNLTTDLEGHTDSKGGPKAVTLQAYLQHHSLLACQKCQP